MCIRPLNIKVAHEVGYWRFNIRQSPTSLVPCGCCPECLKDRQNSWAIRTSNEMRYSKNCYMLTLTYNEDSVPFVYSEDTSECVLSLRKSDVQKWLKRVRRFADYRNIGMKGFKYFLCGEYGGRSLRPHYHLLFFSIPQDVLEYALGIWRKEYGFVCCKRVGKMQSDCDRVGRYVSKYMIKGKLVCDMVRDIVDIFNAEKPFISTSQFYGLLSRSDEMNLIRQMLGSDLRLSGLYKNFNPVMEYAGRYYKIPQFIYKKLHIDEYLEFSSWIEKYFLFSPANKSGYDPRNWQSLLKDIKRLRADNLCLEQYGDFTEQDFARVNSSEKIRLQSRERVAYGNYKRWSLYYLEDTL